MLTPSDVDKSLYVIRTSNAVARFDAILDKGPKGRRSGLTSEILLLGALLCALSGRGMVLTDIYKILTHEIPHDRQVELGIRSTVLGQPTFSQDSVDRRMKAFRDAVEYGVNSAPDLSVGERDRRHDALMDLLVAMMDGTLIGTRSRFLAIDSTGLWSHGRNPGKTGVTDLKESIARLRAEGEDDDADILEWHLKKMLEEESERQAAKRGKTRKGKPVEEDENLRVLGRGSDPDARSSGKTGKDGRTQWYYGYELHALARVAEPGQEYTDEPNLVVRFDVTPAGRGVIKASQGIVNRLPEADGPATIIGDRLYSNLTKENWYDHLTGAGHKQVVDMRESDQSWTDVDGMRVTAGWAHCPKTPDHLMSIPKPVAGSRDQFRARIAERWDYAAEIHEGTVDWRRYTCPAIMGKLRCPLRPETLEAGDDRPYVNDPGPRDTAPTICTQKSVKVHATNPTAGGKLWQEHYWGSDEQLRQSDRRTSIEQVFSKRKDRHGTHMTRGFIRVTGLASFTFAVGLILIAGNIRDLETWVTNGHWDGRDADHPLLQPRSPFVVLHMSHDEAADFEAWRELRDKQEAA